MSPRPLLKGITGGTRRLFVVSDISWHDMQQQLPEHHCEGQLGSGQFPWRLVWVTW